MEEKETFVRRVIREVDDFSKLIKELFCGKNKVRAFLVLIVLSVVAVVVVYEKVKTPHTTQPKEQSSKTKPELPPGEIGQEKGPHQVPPLRATPRPRQSILQEPRLSSPPIDSISKGDDKYNGVITPEPLDKNLIDKLRDADKRLDLEKDADQEVALRIYRETINHLSPVSRKSLNQALLTGADDDYRAGRNRDAVKKYRDLLAIYF